jgi:pimeloyl-ACP methyl ester carboxylesterase
MFDLSPPPPGMPPEQRAQIDAWAGSTQHMTATSAEFMATPNTTAQVGSMSGGGLGATPLAVVSAGEQDPDWLGLQEELATLSTNSRHHVIDGATHTSLVDDPEYARETSAAIRGVVDTARTHQPLTP